MEGDTMTASQQSSGKPVYQLKVTLKGSKPPIWRRIQVPGSITLATLHRIIQVIMGWEDYHLQALQEEGWITLGTRQSQAVEVRGGKWTWAPPG